jgi:hypothetical protein
MERTVPTTGSEEIRLYMRTYYSLLRTTDEVQIQTLVETHLGMDSLLHIRARDEPPDLPALVYCSLRLPPCIRQTRLIVMGQSEQVFARRGYPNVEQWQPVTAAGRRRRSFFDGQETLAVYVASLSDIDDLVPILTAFQIEWNKMHLRLRGAPPIADLAARVADGQPLDDDLRTRLCGTLGVSTEDLGRLETIWREDLPTLLLDIGRRRKRIAVRLLAGSQVEYRKATQHWWENIDDSVSFDLGERPVYFISSNTHSVVNMLSGFALRREETSKRSRAGGRGRNERRKNRCAASGTLTAATSLTSPRRSSSCALCAPIGSIPVCVSLASSVSPTATPSSSTLTIRWEWELTTSYPRSPPASNHSWESISWARRPRSTGASAT